MFRNSFIIDKLNNSILKLAKDNCVSLKWDTFGLFYNKQFLYKKVLLDRYPPLRGLEIQLSTDFESNSTDISFMSYHKGKFYLTIQDLLTLIQNHNSKLIMPKFDSFLS